VTRVSRVYLYIEQDEEGDVISKQGDQGASRVIRMTKRSTIHRVLVSRVKSITPVTLPPCHLAYKDASYSN
jgi:hypothetical protein